MWLLESAPTTKASGTQFAKTIWDRATTDVFPALERLAGKLNRDAFAGVFLKALLNMYVSTVKTRKIPDVE